MRPHPNLPAGSGISAGSRPVNRSRTASRPGLVPLLLAIVVVAALTIGMHFLFR